MCENNGYVYFTKTKGTIRKGNHKFLYFLKQWICLLHKDKGNNKKVTISVYVFGNNVCVSFRKTKGTIRKGNQNCLYLWKQWICLLHNDKGNNKKGNQNRLYV